MIGSKCLSFTQFAVILNFVLQQTMVPLWVFQLYVVCLNSEENFNLLHTTTEEANKTSHRSELWKLCEEHKMTFGLLGLFLYCIAFIFFTLAFVLSFYGADKLDAATKPEISFNEEKKNFDKYRWAVERIATFTIPVVGVYCYLEMCLAAIFHFIPLLLQSNGITVMYFQLRKRDDTSLPVAGFEKAEDLPKVDEKFEEM